MEATARIGQLERIRPDGTLTASYVNSNTVDLQDFNTVVVEAEIGTAQAAKTANLKPQWGVRLEDGTINWMDETELVDGAISGGELPQTPYSRRIDVSMAAAGIVYKERFNRLAEFFRVAAKSDGVTTGTLSLRAQPMRN